jgi:prepilin-type N-terminal cleavage/methylation domain-containing protein
MKKRVLNLKGYKGFTLIEMAVVIIIVGLLVASFSPLLNLKIKQSRMDRTHTNIDAAISAIGGYLLVNGHYPCPASLTAKRTDLDYGHQSNCSDTASIAVGSCANGICIQQGKGTLIHDPDNPANMITVKPRIRVGAIPFRELNLPDESYMRDGYGSLLIYAVTEPLAESATFNAEAGGISIVNDQGASAVSPENSAQFMILSSGANQAGAFLPEGSRNDSCPASGPEAINCAMTATSIAPEAEYRVAQQSDSSTAKFDDVISYSLESDMPLWETSSNDKDIHHKTGGGVGVDLDPDPASKLDLSQGDRSAVNDTVRAQDDLHSVQLCDEEGCFPSSAIAGNLEDGGIKCANPDEYMVGIAHGAAICQKEVVVKCEEPGTFITKINSDHSIECSTPDTPPKPCDAMNVVLCTNESHTLPATPSGGSVPIDAGANFQQIYVCNDGRWDTGEQHGKCVCNPDVKTAPSSCEDGFEGTIVKSQTRSCPSGKYGAWEVTKDTCTCKAMTQTDDPPCPTGYTGSIHRERTHSCGTPEGSWTQWKETKNTCTCTPKTDTRQRDCTGGLEGQMTQQRQFLCPSAQWTQWTTVSQNCSCDSKVETRQGNCPDGYTGETVEQRTFSCPGAKWSAWTTKSSNCVEKPPATCIWTAIGAGDTPSDFHVGAILGRGCTCGAADGPCYRASGNNKYINFAVCKCGG